MSKKKSPIKFPADPKLGLPQTDTSQLYRLFLRGDTEAVCSAICDTLMCFQNTNYRTLDTPSIVNINEFVAAVFALLSNPKFKIPEKWASTFVARAHLFANVVAISTFKTTDAILRHVLLQQHNFVKILFLYSARNILQLDMKKLFDGDARLASIWYYTYPLPQVGAISVEQQANMTRHFETRDERYRPFDFRVASPYFYSTYFAGQSRSDRPLKESINAYCKACLTNTKVHNTPARDSIAIITSKWFPNSAVYKSCSPLVDTLRDKYRLTLIHTDRQPPHQLALDYFDVVHHVKFENIENKYSLAAKEILINDYQLAYFLDVGMTDESVWLSNLRLAPIQVTSLGHPISTFGSEIDYFVVGAETEKLEDLHLNYSECPIVLPGMGCHPAYPTYVRQNLPKKTDKIVGAAIYGPEKWNYTMMRVFQEIHSRAPNFQATLFASRGVNRYNAYIPFVEDLQHQIGDFMELHSDKEYYDYMREMEYSDFTINSFPFGGWNTVMESLYLGKPVVTLEGDRFYNLAASALLRRVGLEELITHSGPEFIGKCVQMINDTSYLQAMKDRLAAVDLHKVLFDTDEPEYFRRAIEHIIDHHEELKGHKEPIYAKDLPSGDL